jgi:HEAT repeat protein
MSGEPLGKLFLEDRYYRIEIAGALEKIGQRSALQYLLQVLPDEKEEIKAAIEQAIEKIVDKNK